MSIDILSALEGTSTKTSGRRCLIGRFIDGIPEDTPGRDELVDTLTIADKRHPHYRPLDKLLVLLARLECDTSIKTIGDHRAERCICHA